MQHRYLTQACTRVVAGMFVGILIAAAPGAFADEVSSSSQNAINSAQSEPASSSSNLQQVNVPAPAKSQGGAKAFLSGMAGKAGDVVVGALNMIGVRYRWAATRRIRASIAAVSSATCSRTRSACRCRVARRR